MVDKIRADFVEGSSNTLRTLAVERGVAEVEIVQDALGTIVLFNGELSSGKRVELSREVDGRIHRDEIVFSGILGKAAAAGAEV